jgi:hypothetical protein
MSSSEEQIAHLAEHIAQAIVNDSAVMDVVPKIAEAEMKQLWGDTWQGIAEAAEVMHPMENHYWCIITEVITKATTIALSNMRHFSND